MSATKCNVLRRQFPLFEEFVVYKRPFYMFERSNDVIRKKNHSVLDFETGEVISMPRQSKRYFRKIDGKKLESIRHVDLTKLKETIKKSLRRSQVNFWNLALSNNWDYVATLTVNQKDFGTDDEEIKRLWKLFNQRLRYRFPDAKILGTPEYTKKGVLHFHALIGNVDLTNHLEEKRHDKTGALLKTKKGYQRYNCTLWGYGFTDFRKIEQNGENLIKCIGYMAKYFTKGFQQREYGARLYYGTKNLATTENKWVNLENEVIEEVVNDLFVTSKKMRNGYVYRVPVGKVDAIIDKAQTLYNERITRYIEQENERITIKMMLDKPKKIVIPPLSEIEQAGQDIRKFGWKK